MSYDIVVRFKNKEDADYWCGQMSDGFGEGFCNFSYWSPKRLRDGSRYREVTAETTVVSGTPIFYVSSIERF